MSVGRNGVFWEQVVMVHVRIPWSCVSTGGGYRGVFSAKGVTARKGDMARPVARNTSL